jgi:hypothetical protein
MTDLIELARLSSVEREVLIAARNNRDSVFIMEMNQGNYLDAGARKFDDRGYMAAVKDLCDAGYFRTPNGQFYELTGRGMEAADALQNPEIIEQLELIRLRKIVLDDLYRFHLLNGFNRAAEPHVQAERLSIELPRVSAVWGYLDRIGALELVPPPEGQGFPLNARLTAFGIQLCEAGDKAALAGPEGASTTTIGDQIIIAGGDAHHIQHGTANVQQEGPDLEALREFIAEHVADGDTRKAALADVDEIGAAANSSDPGIIAKAKDALARLQARLWPYAQRLEAGYTIYKMLSDIRQLFQG